jgi:phosphohistidine phosphatase SixA
MMARIGRVVVLAILGLGLAGAAEADPAAWDLLRAGGQVVLMRHALTTPGVGDPPGFRLEDCATQRNLADRGRADAARVGAAFRARAIPVGRVLSSPWCRCLETARLAFGRAEPWAALGNLFGSRGRAPAQVAAMRERVGERPVDGNLVLVSHGSTIAELSGESLAPAEILVVTPLGEGRFRPAGRIAPSELE